MLHFFMFILSFLKDFHDSVFDAQREVFCKVDVLRNFSTFTRKYLSQSLSFLMKLQASAFNFIKKKTLAQLFSCEHCKISKNTFTYRTTPGAAFWCCISKCSFLQKFISTIVWIVFLICTLKHYMIRWKFYSC